MADQPRVHAITIFDCPEVFLVASEGCLTIHIGGEIAGMTINIYGNDPYKEVPKVRAMTPQEFASHATWTTLKRVQDDDSATIVS